MENNESNPTPSEQANRGLSDEYEKAFDNIMKLLSDLPTDRAMKEMSNGKLGAAVQKVVETMALQKMDLVRSLSLMRFRENLLRHEITALMTKLPLADRVLADFLKENPNYEIVAK